MNVTLKNLIGQCVYKNKDKEPVGKIKGVCFSPEGDKISSVAVESLSLIPLSRTVPIGEISGIGNKKLILQSDVSISRGQDKLMGDKGLKAVCINGRYGKIKDMKFDFETGEITDITIVKDAFARGEKIIVNKMYIKENTIYIE